MRNHRSKTRPLSESITGIAEVTAERVRLSDEVLQKLAFAVAANEEAQRRFRTVVLIRLSKIETVLQMIHGAQLVESRRQDTLFEEKVKQDAKAAEEFISQHSDDLGLKMVKYVYGGKRH